MNSQCPQFQSSDGAPRSRSQCHDVRGWLLLFLAYLGLGVLYFFVRHCILWRMRGEDNLCWSLSELFLGLSVTALALCALAAMVRRKPNAVHLSAAYLVVSFVYSAIMLPLFDTGNAILSLVLMVAMLLDVAWFVYLFKSKVVAARIPKPMRRARWYDWCLPVTALVLPVMLFIAGALVELLDLPVMHSPYDVAAEMDAQCPMSAPPFTCDSVRINAYDNALVSYFSYADNSPRRDYIEGEWMQISDDEIAAEIYQNLDRESLFPILYQARTDMQFVYKRPDGSLLRTVTLPCDRFVPAAR